MKKFSTTKLSSKDQPSISEEIQKSVAPDVGDSYQDLIVDSRRLAQSIGLSEEDISEAIQKIRKN